MTIIKRETVNDFKSNGLNNTAAAMDKSGIVARLVIRKGNGKKLYTANEFLSGKISKLVG